jgi:hypothetical protein
MAWLLERAELRQVAARLALLTTALLGELDDSPLLVTQEAREGLIMGAAKASRARHSPSCSR